MCSCCWCIHHRFIFRFFVWLSIFLPILLFFASPSCFAFFPYFIFYALLSSLYALVSSLCSVASFLDVFSISFKVCYEKLQSINRKPKKKTHGNLAWYVSKREYVHCDAYIAHCRDVVDALLTLLANEWPRGLWLKFFLYSRPTGVRSQDTSPVYVWGAVMGPINSASTVSMPYESTRLYMGPSMRKPSTQITKEN